MAFASTDLERPADAEWPAWAGYLYAAWLTLRDDRFYGAMGGLGRIYYTAISAYAADHGIAGSGFHDFVTFITAMDDEYVAYSNELAKAESEKNKRDKP